MDIKPLDLQGKPNTLGKIKEESLESSEESGKMEETTEKDVLPPIISHRKKSIVPSLFRPQWDSQWEFMVSCIAMTIGLGNIWRFPVQAYQNGGGAFLIPYLLVLIFIGIPIYFMELSLGQFTSRNQMQVWKCAPIFKGVGFATLVAAACILTYYCAIIAIPVYYFVNSFRNPLPWDDCKEEWAGVGNCDGKFLNRNSRGNGTMNRTLADLYFKNKVLKEYPDIYDGIGNPDGTLTLCLIFSWVVIYFSILKGIKSSGKVAYFTATFPYCVLFVLLVRGVTLPGARQGIMYFITPVWDKLLDLDVWYQAAAQCFFSLNTGLGSIIMFSSHNPLRYNILRDAIVFSFVDTVTSIVAGLTTFAILGNLAYEMDVNIDSVLQGNDLGLAFVSYPDAIVKIGWAPQLFAVLFFAMLFTLGVGSATAQAGTIACIFCDTFPQLREWVVNLVICIIGCSVGLIYITPGGQHILKLVDFFGVSLIIYVTSTMQVIGVAWCYGLYNFIGDVEFMLGIKLGYFWKISWGIVIPIFLGTIFMHNIIIMGNVGMGYPATAITCGWLIFSTTGICLVLGAIHAMSQASAVNWLDKFKLALKPRYDWGPREKKCKEEWQIFIIGQDRRTFLQRIRNFFGIMELNEP